MVLQETTTVQALLNEHPSLLHTFIKMGLRCVGCSTDAFHSLADVAAEYKLDPKQLITILQTAIDQAEDTKERIPQKTSNEE